MESSSTSHGYSATQSRASPSGPSPTATPNGPASSSVTQGTTTSPSSSSRAFQLSYGLLFIGTIFVYYT
jgi:hypothetical protein